MKSTIVTARPGKEIRLSKIEPDDTGGINKKDAVQRCAELREKIGELQEILHAEHQRSLLILFQSLDAGGKDSAIKNLFAGLNPAGVHVSSFKVPSQEEADHDFLWRAHKVTPSKGTIGIWNRSHYEDVLVARVHKLVKKKVWEARYDQITAFEQILIENGVSVVKFMLHISKDEQKKRLQERVDRPEKRWKFSPSDAKERAYWDDYQEAYEDAINRCTTDEAPWHIVPANKKWSRDIVIVELILGVLKKMDLRYPTISFDPKAIPIE